MRTAVLPHLCPDLHSAFVQISMTHFARFLPAVRQNIHVTPHTHFNSQFLSNDELSFSHQVKVDWSKITRSTARLNCFFYNVDRTTGRFAKRQRSKGHRRALVKPNQLTMMLARYGRLVATSQCRLSYYLQDTRQRHATMFNKISFNSGQMSN